MRNLLIPTLPKSAKSACNNYDRRLFVITNRSLTSPKSHINARVVELSVISSVSKRASTRLAKRCLLSLRSRRMKIIWAQDQERTGCARKTRAPRSFLCPYYFYSPSTQANAYLVYLEMSLSQKRLAVNTMASKILQLSSI